jgi:acylphosphatase
MIQTKRILVKGRVQGVGFRFFTKNTANMLGLVGFCRNLADGSVEAVVNGDQEIIEKFLGHLKQGPTLANVTGLKEETAPKEDFVGFEIRD